MNLHQIVSGAIGVVNPHVIAQLYQSTGYTTADDGTQMPSYAAPVRASVQVQALSSDELKLVDGLNVQGNKQAIYLNGNWQGLVRPDHRGGDLIKLGDTTYLVITVLESWPDWTKLAVVLQNGG
jgi:hypothetical protein